MHRHRIAAFLAGCLILGSLFMIFVATQNFGTVDRVLAAPPQEAARMFQTLGPQNARLLLRYLAGEENRLFFTSWEWCQIALGALLTAVLLLAVKSAKGVARTAGRGEELAAPRSVLREFDRSRLLAGLTGTMTILAMFQRFRVTPEMISLGRLIDFGGGSGSAAYNQFWRLHGLYGVLEVVKLALLIVVAAILLFGRRAKTPEPIEAIPVVSTFAEP
jgi:di/tricarboxylate transporter